MNKKNLFYILLAVGIVSLLLAIDYYIPNTPHLLASSIRHKTHAMLFAGIGIVAIIAALANRKKVS